ncbi:ethylene-insensitive protein 2-like isoform X2 [Andrographis paniculata]|uniref:ethylene-insensitive protein 2-like isoform X2 n=1 Tax=Andrographis paniculata TaxID=175694 RepID=UPI0021E73322|nr:ethylene-insensitive protein 2-like isoform X2 [Andrographis paniculata]
MESEKSSIELLPRNGEQALAALRPLLWVVISYLDPGKWAAALEGGAQFGLDLILLMVVINFVAILCHYISARIAIATGRNLVQICREEYDNTACVLLGIQAEISMVVLDLTMVLGTACGLNAISGISLCNCVLLSCFDAILFPIFTNLLGNSKAKICMCLLCFLLLFCVSGVLMNPPERSLSVGGLLSDLTMENAYALMAILGANMMPHNFYLHSSIVQQNQGHRSVSKGELFNYHFFAIFGVFSGIFVANCMLVNLASNVFYSSGLTSLTLQDAVLLMDQGFRSSLASIALIFIMLFSNQLVAATWGLEKQVIANDFFKLKIPGWFHCAGIRITTVMLAISCVWKSGAEGIFQLLIFAQVMVALLLPSSLIPLFQVASSRPIMGAYIIPRPVEFAALASFIGILGLNIIFIIELTFGRSHWVTSLKWNIGTRVPILYLILLVAGLSSLSLMLWLAITPLKSARSRVDMHALQWDKQAVVTEFSMDGGETEAKEAQHQSKSMEKWEPVPSSSSDVNLPKTFLESSAVRNSDDTSVTTFSITQSMESESVEVQKSQLPDDGSLHTELKEVVETTPKNEGDGQMERVNIGDEEFNKDVVESSQALASDGPGSFRSLGGKVDDVGCGAGSLSTLGRASRRQLTSVLDEFWGQLFDRHGQVTPEAKSKKLDKLFGIDCKVDLKSSPAPAPAPAPVKSETMNIEPTRCIGRGSYLRNSTSYSPSIQNVGPNNGGLSLGLQPGSPRWSNYTQLLDSYNALESMERRYHSVHARSSTQGQDKQPAMIQGFNMASYMSRMAQENSSDYLKSQFGSVEKGSDFARSQLSSVEKGSENLKSPLGSVTQPSAFLVKSNNLDPYSRPVGQKSQNVLRAPPGFHNVPIHRNSSLRFERPSQELSSPESVDYTNRDPPGEKKFHSLPNISGLYGPRSNSSYSGGVHRQFISPQVPEQATLSTVGLGRHDTKVCRDALPSQLGSNFGTDSLWSKQPYEQFGVADKCQTLLGSRETPPSPSFMDCEAKLLHSFRSTIMKLSKLEGMSWLFRQNDGADEDLIGRVAEREKFLYELETMTSDRNLSSAMKVSIYETEHSKLMSVPNCGDGCVWGVDLVVSFGVWCVHRILELSLVESRPELWGKYTYVLNRLQGIIDLGILKKRSPPPPCFCLQLPDGYEQKSRSSWPVLSSNLPPQSKVGRGKVTTAAMILELIKDVEVAISCRKGRSGTAAGDVAFPNGKKNLSSVLKRYKRRLSNDQAASPNAHTQNSSLH